MKQRKTWLIKDKFGVVKIARLGIILHKHPKYVNRDCLTNKIRRILQTAKQDTQYKNTPTPILEIINDMQYAGNDASRVRVNILAIETPISTIETLREMFSLAAQKFYVHNISIFTLGHPINVL